MGRKCRKRQKLFYFKQHFGQDLLQTLDIKKTNRLPLVLMTSFRLLVVAFFIVMVVHKFLTEDAKVSLLLLLISVIVLAQSKWLLTQYMKIEAQFLANLRGHHGEKAEPSEKADD